MLGSPHVRDQVHEILLVRRRDHTRRNARLVIDRLEAGGCAHRRHARTVGTGGGAFVQDRAIGEHRHPLALAFHDRRLPCFGEIAAAADHLNTLGAQQLDCIEQRLRAPIHRVIAGNRNDIEAAICNH